MCYVYAGVRSAGGRAVSVSDLLEAAVAAGLWILRRHGPVVSLARMR